MKTQSPRRRGGLRGLLHLQRLLAEAGINMDVMPREKPAKRPLTARQRQTARQCREQRAAELKAYGRSARIRRFRRMMAKRFEVFLPPCPKCANCERRMEKGLGGFGRFCNDCLETDRDELYRAQREWEAMRAYFKLKPHQRLSQKRKDQYLIDTIYGKTPSLKEIYYGSDD